ncbi:MAG: nascent polypeptide-associated complex protein [Halovenus sp.]|uniref:nascent polypeptide-associated complex protein n=1 Tax=Halovenus amylolytica TaxID=2500550 RepID=UPI000FE2BED7
MFGGGGGGLDSRKMQQMMKQMGIDIDELDAEEVIIRTADEELVFENPDVQHMDAQGQDTYNVVGTPNTRELGEGSTTEADESTDDSDDGIPQEDIETVADAAGVSQDQAREALEANDGMPLDAIESLEE